MAKTLIVKKIAGFMKAGKDANVKSGI